MNKEALIEATKEAGRVVLLSILPILIASIESGRFDWRLIAVTAELALLRWVDKYLHEKEMAVAEKERNAGYLGVHGLTGF